MTDWPSGTLVLGSPQWTVPVLIVAAGLIGLVVWNYARQTGMRRYRIAAAILKITAIVLLAGCLLQPKIRAQRPRPRANVLPILVDNSQSMRLQSAEDSVARGKAFAAAMQPDLPWRVRLAQDFDVRDYRFDSRINPLDEPESLRFDGLESPLQSTLRAIAKRFDGRPVGGLVLMTDGNSTDATENVNWSDLGFPVYPVVSGNEQPLQDLRIESFSVRQTDFETAPVTVNVTMAFSGTERKECQVRLVDTMTGRLVEQQNVTLGPENDRSDVRFRFRPAHQGIGFYRADVFADADRQAMPLVPSHDATSIGSGDNPTLVDRDDEPAEEASRWEATLANNRRLIAIDRKGGPYRILYVSGRPNWDFKFLRRALQEDAEIQLVGLIRIADKEPKFTFRDSQVNDTNPLFAGLGNDEEEAAQQYDEPVILRLGVKESEELSEGFPETPEELFAYHAVILDDVEVDFFSTDQLMLLRRFVSARGGGLLLMGGQESFAGRDFQNSPLGELSPVYSDASGQQRVTTTDSERHRLDMTREGLLQPWVRLRQTEEAEAKRLREMPTFRSINRVGAVKPGATRLMTLTSAGGETLSALVVQRFGLGRSVAMPMGDAWRWSMRREESSDDDPAQAWRQLAHWMVGEVPRRVEASVGSLQTPSQPTRLVIEARDEAYLPLDNAEVKVRVSNDSTHVDLIAQPDASTSGRYVAEYWSRKSGGYRAAVTVTAADGSPVGDAEMGWVVERSANEFAELSWNRTLLQRIADESGGEVISADRLAEFAADLPNRKVPLMETWVYPLWHQPWVISLAVVCLCGEWCLRRIRGLP